MTLASRRLCFVVPRFFEGLAGGAETLLSNLAVEAAHRGCNVELLATCARDNRTWENAFSAGEEHYKGVRLHRFPVDSRNLDVWIPIQSAIHDGQSVSYDDQLRWMEESVNSRAMYRYIAENQSRFDAIILGPYLFGTTFWGSQIAPQKTILVPCLHDEPYAYLEIIATMFRSVGGCIFNALPEQELACSLYGSVEGGVVGMGFESLPDQSGVASGYFEHDFPYVLYLGRKETGKNVHLLVDYFCESKDSGTIPESCKLVVLGGGNFDDLHRQDALSRSDVIDLPHVSEEEKERIIAGALCMCQPSCNESFSIVLMESWQKRVPVVVHAECPVTRFHVEESAGGLYFGSAFEFAGVVTYLLERSQERRSMGDAGFSYVKDRYSWDSVMRRFSETLRDLIPSPEVSNGDCDQTNGCNRGDTLP
jgi:glycosyltransferase involved in cell wall biosynthesis